MTSKSADSKPTPPAPAGVVPHLALGDANAALELYTRAFGAEVLATIPAQDGKRLMHSHLVINKGALFVMDVFPEHGHPVETPQGFVLHLQVDDADKWFDRAVAAGCTVVMPCALQFWGDRYGQVKDPFGVRWSIGGPNR